MGAPVVVFDQVSKKFRRGERHDSLRDLIPHAIMRLYRNQPQQDLGENEFWALRDVSFDIQPGEGIGIVGPNGAGKSTSLKLLTKILRPTCGRCFVSGRVGALIEVAAGFHPDLTGRENIFLQGAIIGMKQREVALRFDEIVEFAGVGQFIDTPVKRYSSGMNARLGFSIAAHFKPDVLIIDEVLSVGDMAFQEKCVSRMERFLADGVSIVFVSHNLQAVSKLCRRTAYLNGSVRAIGPTSEVIQKFVMDSSSSKNRCDRGRAIVVLGGLADRQNNRVAVAPPSTLMTLVASYPAFADPDHVTLGFIVRRSTDNLVVYDANIRGSELRLTSDDTQSEQVVRFTFRANLTRGHYNIELHLFDTTTQTFVSSLRPAATFAIDESRTYAGVADLQLDAASVLEPGFTVDAAGF